MGSCEETEQAHSALRKTLKRVFTGVVLLPGDTGRCLGTSVGVVTEGGPGIEWEGAGILLSTPQGPGRPTESQAAPVPAVPRERSLTAGKHSLNGGSSHQN